MFKKKKIAYICDKKACGTTCPSPDLCNHTLDIRHSLNYRSSGEVNLRKDFICIDKKKKEKIYIEVEK